MAKDTKLPIAQISPVTVNEVTIQIDKHTNVLGYIREVCEYATNYKKVGIKFSWIVGEEQKTFTVEANKYNTAKHSIVTAKKQTLKGFEVQNIDIQPTDKLEAIKLVLSGFAANYLHSICNGFDYSNLRFSKASGLMAELKKQPNANNVIWQLHKINFVKLAMLKNAIANDKLLDANCTLIAAGKAINASTKELNKQYKALITPNVESIAKQLNQQTRENRTKETV